MAKTNKINKPKLIVTDVTKEIFGHYFQKYLNEVNPYKNVNFEVVDTSECHLNIEKIRVRCRISCATEAFVFDKVKHIDLDRIKADFGRNKAQLDICISTNYGINVNIKADTEKTEISSNFGDQTLVFETSKDVILRYFDVVQEPISKFQFMKNCITKNLRILCKNNTIEKLVFGGKTEIFSKERKINNLKILAENEAHMLSCAGAIIEYEEIINKSDVLMIDGIKNSENVNAIVENGYVFKFIETELSPSGDDFKNALLRYSECTNLPQQIVSFKNRNIKETLGIDI